jgi:hypothetical protein
MIAEVIGEKYKVIEVLGKKDGCTTYSTIHEGDAFVVKEFPRRN